MKLSGIDANLLAALDALLREKSVTRAAKTLGVGQPALSHSLARLREHFNDELLVLRGRNYVLTNKAEKLAGVVANATRALAEVFEERPIFQAATCTTRFVLACSDLLGTQLLPKLLQTLSNEAQYIGLEVRAVLASCDGSYVEPGVDIAAGLFENVPATMNQQMLYSDPVICLVRADHPRVSEQLTLATYCALPHLEIGSAAAIPGLQIDRALSALGHQRIVSLRTPYYLLATSILEHTDHIATVPASCAALFGSAGNLRVLTPPIQLPDYVFSQVWPNDRNDDPAHAWLRAQIATICQERHGLTTRKLNPIALSATR